VNFEEGLTVELSALSGLTGKVFPVLAAQGTLTPYLTYTLDGIDRVKTLSGHDGLVQSRYELNLYHSAYASLKTLKALVIANLKTHDLTNIGASGPLIQQIEIITDFETYEETTKLFKGIIEFEVHYTE
jgi:hypothetical protein